MSETMPDTPKSASRQTCFLRTVLCPVFLLKIAAGIFILAGAGFLTCFIASTLSVKSPGWEAALPTATMSEEQVDVALLRSAYLHEATVRPLLIRAGIVSAKDIASHGNKQDKGFSSKAVANALWSMRPFPEVHERALAALLDASVAPEKRVMTFYMVGNFLSATAEGIVGNGGKRRFSPRDFRQGEDLQKPQWFAQFHSASGTTDPEKALPADKKGRASFAEKYTLAKRVLPLIQADIQKELALTDETRTEESGQAAQKSLSREQKDDAHALMSFLKHARAPVHNAVRVMLRERDNPGFFTLAQEVLASEDADLISRYLAVPLIAEKPGLQAGEYLFWQRNMRDANGITFRAGGSPVAFVHQVRGSKPFLAALTEELTIRGTVTLGGQTGPGVLMDPVKKLVPPYALSGNLYLLADTGKALKEAPEYALGRALPVFQGRLLRHMKNQPLILPLNPGNPKDAAVIAWYAQKGWKQGHTLLFSAVGTPMEVAQHWGTLHLVWWPETQTPAYLRPANGHFMAALLPHLKGKAATRFLGPITGLWFGRQTADKNGWVDELYAARPEVMPAPLSARRTVVRSALVERLQNGQAAIASLATPIYTEETATLALHQDLWKALEKAFSHNNRVILARKLAEKDADNTLEPLHVCNFVNSTIPMLHNWDFSKARDVIFATKLLWQHRNNAAATVCIQDILANKNLHPKERLQAVRRMLLPEAKKGEGRPQ